MSTELVTLSIAARQATITLNAPPANLLTTAMLNALDDAVGSVAGNEAVRVVVLTAAGRMFCAGADIRELSGLKTLHEGTALSRRGQAVLTRIEGLEKPVIAAINGACLGGGLELALACHLRIAAAGTVLGLPEITLGLIPGFGGTQRLPRIIGAARAAEMMLTGDRIPAAEALALGLLNRVVPPDDLPAQTSLLAEKIASKGRLAIRSLLQALRAGLDHPPVEGLAHEAALFGALCDTPDKWEGIQAFLEKRKPKFH
jgi:enoyl-CoA hydratase/carnithine racemase